MQDNKLKEIAKEVRKDILTATCKAQSGHPGGSLSATDILVCLYFSKMKHNPKKPSDPDRDRFILSKGHAAIALYTTLFHRGFFSRDILNTYYNYCNIMLFNKSGNCFFP